MLRARFAQAAEWIDRALTLPGEEANPAYRISARCVMVRALWRLGRGVEVAPLLAEAETIARALADPSTLSQVLQLCAGRAEGEIATSYADEALDLAAAAGSA